jgi:4-hydroxy-3-methylbut-2-enyl diphosphate reductase IspH
MGVIPAQPRGFCAGVVRAIDSVERALQKYGPLVHVRHEIVHNKFVVESLERKGAISVEDLSEVPPRAVTIVSAHGVSGAVESDAAAPVADVTQTTLSVDDTLAVVAALERRFTHSGPHAKDTCYATHNRQVAVRELSG